VLRTKAKAEIETIVSSRIYPDVAPQDTVLPHLIYLQVDGQRIVNHDGPDNCRTIAMHVYAIAESQPTANELASLVEDHWLASNNSQAGSQRVMVCNGGIVESGQWFPKDSSDNHMFFSRVALRMLVSG